MKYYINSFNETPTTCYDLAVEDATNGQRLYENKVF